MCNKHYLFHLDNVTEMRLQPNVYSEWCVQHGFCCIRNVSCMLKIPLGTWHGAEPFGASELAGRSKVFTVLTLQHWGEESLMGKKQSILQINIHIRLCCKTIMSKEIHNTCDCKRFCFDKQGQCFAQCNSCPSRSCNLTYNFANVHNQHQKTVQFLTFLSSPATLFWNVCFHCA